MEFMEKAKEKEISKVSKDLETIQATVEAAEDGFSPKVKIENHINNSDSSDSGFSEMCSTEVLKCGDGEVVKIEVVTTETTYLSYKGRKEILEQTFDKFTQSNSIIEENSIEAEV